MIYVSEAHCLLRDYQLSLTGQLFKKKSEGLDPSHRDDTVI